MKSYSSVVVHWENPWEEAIPVPIEELVDCVHGIGEQWTDSDGSSFIMTREKMLEHWGQCGRDKLDAYILPFGYGFCIGVRYGNEGPEYYSPHGVLEKIQALYNKYAV